MEKNPSACEKFVIFSAPHLWMSHGYLNIPTNQRPEKSMISSLKIGVFNKMLIQLVFIDFHFRLGSDLVFFLFLTLYYLFIGHAYADEYCVCARVSMYVILLFAVLINNLIAPNQNDENCSSFCFVFSFFPMLFVPSFHSFVRAVHSKQFFSPFAMNKKWCVSIVVRWNVHPSISVAFFFLQNSFSGSM